MSNHLTPDELAGAIGMRPDRLVRFCIEQSIPIYQGRVDKTLVLTSLQASGQRLPGGSEHLLAA